MSAFNILTVKPTRKRLLGKTRRNGKAILEWNLKKICVNTRN